MKSLARQVRILFHLITGVDWEYIIPMAFCYLKYKNHAARISALRHLKYAYFERRFSDIVEKYKILSTEHKTTSNDGPVWVCWLQGEAAMPEVVKVCYQQLRSVVPPSRQVILITWDNLKEYADIPDYIIEKLRKGLMSYTHFSDILRFTLLAKHGGLWVDSTVYVSSPIPESIFNKPYFSVRTEFGAETEYKYDGVNRGLWKCFIIGAAPHSLWLSCARDIIFEYWKNNNFFIDYFIVEYILLLIYDQIGLVRRQVNSSVEIAPHLYALEKLRNCAFNQSDYAKLCNECQWYKLSYKLKSENVTSQGDLTYFGYIMQNA